MTDEPSWYDHPVCPPCLVDRAHGHCDGDRWWCECLHDDCLPIPSTEDEQL